MSAFFYAKLGSHGSYDCTELDGHWPNSLGGVALERYHWNRCIRASLVQLNNKNNMLEL